jgi:uncharacterized Zn-binding protein involved in type VI secretion
MRKPLALLIIGLFFGSGFGFLIAASNGITLDGHNHDHNVAAKATMDHGHNHDKIIDLPEGADAPTIEVVMHKDAVSGWNLQIVTTNFSFTPKNVNRENTPGEGHAHVYVNGEKLARLYSPWMHIGKLPAGQVTVSASLNANDHSIISVGNKPLSAETVIQTP